MTTKARELKIECPLCKGLAGYYLETKDRRYYKCPECCAIFLGSENYLSKDLEKARYLKHNNNVHDSGYLNFIQPIISNVQNNFNHQSLGLDFGAGPNPVLAKILEEKNYKIEIFDPFFYNHSHLLDKKYDFIICSEVIEHFHYPAKEFKLLKSLLKSHGKLLCMTDLYNDQIDFKNWYYKNDITHVFFYTNKTIYWIKNNMSFSNYAITGRIITWCLD